MEATNKTILKLCKELGCCDACCIRYIGLKSPDAYENAKEFVAKHIETENATKHTASEETAGNGEKVDNELVCEGTPAKRCKLEDVCVSCMGILQEQTWPECLDKVEKMMEEKQYSLCKVFACALSAPLSTIVHERGVTNKLEKQIEAYDKRCVTPLKEAWKWCFGPLLADRLQMTMESGAIAPLLITISIEYTGETQELDSLRALSPTSFPRQQLASRRAVESALSDVTATQCDQLLTSRQWVHCASATAQHVPMYLGGRYIKTSRQLPQTPWVVEGRRIMESSVQEIIFEPVAEAYGIPVREMNDRLKFMSAGREDVDVRCLGDGRPFAIEITDPRREFTADELRAICERITKSGSVRVHTLIHVTKERLADLKKGEETKQKTYELLCIKLGHTPDDIAEGRNTGPVSVTAGDIARMRHSTRVTQRTPLRVLHRRPLAARDRTVQVSARPVPPHPQLMVLTVLADAGTYIKEWAHGEAGRSRPNAATQLQAPLDILALDLLKVHLDWP